MNSPYKLQKYNKMMIEIIRDKKNQNDRKLKLFSLALGNYALIQGFRAKRGAVAKSSSYPAS